VDQRWAIIANPKAGRGQAVPLARELVRAIQSQGDAVVFDTTAKRGDAEQLAIKAVENGATRVIACGGDGTAHEVVNGLMSASSAKPLLGLLPTGRGNDLAEVLGLPKDTARVTDVLLNGAAATIDLGCVGDRYFATVATCGFDSEVSHRAHKCSEYPLLRGAFAYIYGVLVTLVRYVCKHVRLKGDFGEFRGSAFLVATANARQYGGGMKIVPEASIDDGCLDVCIVRPISKLQVVRMLPRVFSGTHVTHPAVDIKKSRLLEITSGEPLSLWADGEPVGSTPATIEVVPQALRVLVSAASNTNGAEPYR